MKKTTRRLVSLLCMLCILASVWLPLLPAAGSGSGREAGSIRSAADPLRAADPAFRLCPLRQRSLAAEEPGSFLIRSFVIHGLTIAAPCVIVHKLTEISRGRAVR